MVNKRNIWLPLDILSGETQRGSHRYVQDEEWKKHYEILDHANYLLGIEKSEHDRACAIFQLNRAVELRDKFLNKIYQFRKIKGFKGLGQNEIMERLDMIKPMMKGKLDSIRNKVMHKANENIPSRDECYELSEFVWYFLRVTDIYARNIVDDFSIYSTNKNIQSEIYLSINLSNRTYSMALSLQKNLIEEICTNQHLELSLEKEIYDGEGDYFHLKGTVIPTVDTEKIIMRKFFESYHD